MAYKKLDTRTNRDLNAAADINQLTDNDEALLELIPEDGDFLKPDGSVPLTADWDAGDFKIRARTLQSDVAAGTSPLTVASDTEVANLNAAKVGGCTPEATLTDSTTKIPRSDAVVDQIVSKAAFAYAKFDGTNLTTKSGTYAVVSNVVTVTIANHGLNIGDEVWVDYTSGAGAPADAWGTVLATGFTSGVFKINYTTANASGNCQFKTLKIYQSHNVANIIQRGGVNGAYLINFTTTASTNDFACTITAFTYASAPGVAYINGRNVHYVYVITTNLSAISTNYDDISVLIFGGGVYT